MAKMGSAIKREREVPGKEFQNGGSVSALVIAALKMGMIKSAILTGGHGIVPDPKVVTTPGEVLECAASRYIAAPTMARFNRAACEGGKDLGVVGTPCQMTGLANLRVNPLEAEDFKDPTGIAIGLFCTWALNGHDFLAYLKARNIDPDHISFMDIPPPPATAGILTLEARQSMTDQKDSSTDKDNDHGSNSNGQEVKIPLDDLRKLVLPGCAVCPDMTSLYCDISVGALEHDPKWNTLIVRTEKGERLVDYAVEKGLLTTAPLSGKSLDALSIAAQNKKERAVSNQRHLGMLDPEFEKPLKQEPKKTIMGFR
jgi:coenzyme F420 hydrogenase subunit beta